MAIVKQEYLKNEEGEIFSPITSSDSIYINPRFWWGGGNQLGTRLLYGGFPIVLGREIHNNSNYYKIFEFILPKEYSSVTFNIKLFDEENTFDMVNLYFSGRVATTFNQLIPSQHKFIYDSLSTPGQSSHTMTPDDFSLILTDKITSGTLELYQQLHKANTYIFGQIDTIILINEATVVSSFLTKVNKTSTLPTGTKTYHPTIRKYTN